MDSHGLGSDLFCYIQFKKNIVFIVLLFSLHCLHNYKTLTSVQSRRAQQSAVTMNCHKTKVVINVLNALW